MYAHTNTPQLWIECVPVKELRQIKIEFPIPDLDQYYYCDVRRERERVGRDRGQGGELGEGGVC